MIDRQAAPEPSAKEFWRALGERAIGATIVTASDMAGPAGFFCLSAAHVSADPPTLLISVDHKTAASGVIKSSGHFKVNVLSKGALRVLELFVGPKAAKGAERFTKDDWIFVENGAPILKHALAVFDCAVETQIDVGRTMVFIGRVTALTAKGQGDPLIFFRGGNL